MTDAFMIGLIVAFNLCLLVVIVIGVLYLRAVIAVRKEQTEKRSKYFPEKYDEEIIETP